MELKGERLLAADRATVWSLLNDPEILRLCVPGCESIAATAEHSYDIVMNAAVGPVRARFKGTLALADIEAPARYRLKFEAHSPQVGFVRGDAQVALQELAPTQTQLSYAAQSHIGGKLAQIGGRLIDAAAAATADKFFDSLAAQLGSRTRAATVDAATEPASAISPRAPATASRECWRWLSSFVRHLFARRS